MFDKLHLLSQDVPEGGDGFRWKAHPYLRIAGTVPKGPAVFDWSARQRSDIEALWRDPTADGARERLAKDLAAFCERLGWTPEPKLLEDAEKAGEEYMVTLSAAAPELYILPWEVVQIGAEGQYLSDYASAQVRYAMPGLDAREVPPKPELPGVLFAWSGAGGEVPHDEQAAAIRAAAEAGGVAFRELADVDEVSLQTALDAGAPSVLHLLCHGLPGPDGEPSRLSWGAVDNPSEITATRLARLVRRHDSAIRMVVLSTCGGGDGYDNPMLLGSVAQELHKKGIRSVVASRYPLSVCGSSVMTRSLYDKLLRDAWSLERSLRYTREALLRVADHGETHPGDAYGIQLYAYDMERFVSDNEVEAERPVLATYPFGTADHPVPAHGPPVTELTLTMENEPKLTEDELVAKLRRVAEDEHLTVAIPLDAKPGDCKLHVHTTMDGAQRLLGAWRSKILHVVIGVAIGKLVLANGLGHILQTIASTVVGKASAGTLAASIGAAGGSVGTAAGSVGTAAGSVGAAAGSVGAAAGSVGAVGAAAGNIGAAGGSVGAATGSVGAAAGKGGAAVGGAAGKIGMGAARAGTPTSQVGSAAKVGSAVGKASATVGKAGAAVGQTAAAGGQAAVVGQVGVAAGHAGASAASAGLGAAGGAGGAGIGAAGGAGGAGLGAVSGAGGAGLGAVGGAGGAGLGAVGGAGGAGLGAVGGAGGAGLGAAGGAGAGAVGAGAGLGAAGAAGGAGLAVAGGAGGAAMGAVGGAAGLGAAGAGLGAAGAGLGAAGAGKLAAVLALVGNAVSVKVVVALVGAAALAGSVAVYRAETRPPQATEAAAGEAAAPGPAKSSDPARRGTRARGTASPASAATVVEPTASPDLVAGAPSAIGGGPSPTAGGPTGTGEAAATMRNAPAGGVAGSAATAQMPSTMTGKAGGGAGARSQDGAAGGSAGRAGGTADGAAAKAPGSAGATGGAGGTKGEAVAAAPGPAGATGGSAANADETAMPGGPAGAAGGSTGAAATAPAGAMGESPGGSTRAVPANGEVGAAGGPTGAAAAASGPGGATGGSTATVAANGSGSAATGSAAGSPPRAGEPTVPAAEAKAERPPPAGQVAATGARVAPASGGAAAPSPSEAAAPQPSDPSAAAEAKPAAAVCGNGTKEAGEQCDDGNTRDGDGCSAKCRLEPVAIAPSALELERVSGNTDIHPSKQTRSAMIAAGVNSVTGVVRLCVDTAGAVTEVSLQDATGYAEYDRKLVAAVREWRFHPFVIHGTAMAVCSTTEFVYAPK